MTFRLESLGFRYAADGPDEALVGVTALIAPGQTTAIVGLSGSGKSTLLALLGLLLGDCGARKDLVRGEMTFIDRHQKSYHYRSLRAPDRERLRLHEFGFVLQSGFLMPHFTARRNVTMPLALLGWNERDQAQRLDETLAALGGLSESLRGLLDRPASTCSGGERQRLAILRAVIHHPSVVFADEPTSNLDVVNQEAVLALLQSWKEAATNGKGDRTLVLVTHFIGHAADHADRVLALHQGRLVGDRVWSISELGTTREQRMAAIERMIRTGVAPDPVRPSQPSPNAGSDSLKEDENGRARESGPSDPARLRLTDRLRFLAGFSRKDLFAAGVRLPTWTNIAGITAVLCACIVGLALVDGAAQVQRAALERDRENLCLRGGQAFLAAVDDKFLERLATALRDQEGLRGNHIYALTRYSQTKWKWIAKNGKTRVELKGRTVRQGDPLFQNRPVRRWMDARRELPADPLDCHHKGVVVTESMLTELGYVMASSAGAEAEVEEPHTLQLEMPGGLPPLDVPVLGIAARPLPDDFQFAWSAAFYSWLIEYNRQKNVVQESPFQSGPVPDSWISAMDENRLPDGVSTFLTQSIPGFGASTGPEVVAGDDGRRRWSFELSGKTYEFWAELLSKVREVMVEEQFEDAPVLVPAPRGFAIDPCDASIKPKELDNFVAVYVDVKNLESLEAIAKVMSGKGFDLRANKDVARALKEIARQSNALLGVLGAVVLLVAVLAVLNTFSQEILRADARKAEIGMLRAIGMSRELLCHAAVFEALLQWLLALGFATVLVLASLPFLPILLYDNRSDHPYALRFVPWKIVSACSFSALLAVATTLLASRGARNADPAEMVRSR